MRLTEFGDLSVMPRLYHLYLRKYLVFFYSVFVYYKLWVPFFEKFILTANSDVIVECCAGSGEPLQLLLNEAQSSHLLQQRFVMTDLYPQPEFSLANK